MSISLEEQENLQNYCRMWCSFMCDVCRKERAVGVASTLIPFSAAFGQRCLKQNAQPLWVVNYLLEESHGIQNCDKWFLDYCKVFLRGVYMTVRAYDQHLKLRGR